MSDHCYVFGAIDVDPSQFDFKASHVSFADKSNLMRPIFASDSESDLLSHVARFYNTGELLKFRVAQPRATLWVFVHHAAEPEYSGVYVVECVPKV